MEGVQKAIKEALANSKSPAVLCSFGKDSMLLLDLVLAERPDTPVVWFPTSADNRFAHQVITERSLMVFSWQPANIYRIGSSATIIAEYGWGPYFLPVVVDTVPGDCRAGIFHDRTPTVYPPFDLVFVGWKETDSHWVKGHAKLDLHGAKLGRATMSTPLRHMTDEAVRAAIIDRKIPFEPAADELPVCGHCKDCQDIPGVELEDFRARYNLKES